MHPLLGLRNEDAQEEGEQGRQGAHAEDPTPAARVHAHPDPLEGLDEGDCQQEANVGGRSDQAGQERSHRLRPTLHDQSDAQ